MIAEFDAQLLLNFLSSSSSSSSSTSTTLSNNSIRNVFESKSFDVSMLFVNVDQVNAATVELLSLMTRNSLFAVTVAGLEPFFASVDEDDLIEVSIF